MNVESINIDYSLKFDKDLDIMNGSGSIKAVLNEDSNECVYIGNISYNFYNVHELGGNDDLLDNADGVSGDELYMVSTLLQNDFDFEFGGKLVTLDRIMIEEVYYNEDLEQQVLKEFLHYCSYMMFDYVLVIACRPIKTVDSQEIIEFPQLKLYTELNFKYIGGSENRAPVMLKNLHQID